MIDSEASNIDILARTIWAEARGERRLGMVAVASVIINRAKHPRWWGHSIKEVCLKPWQFSCWNSNDPNRKKLLSVDTDDEKFAEALDIAVDAVRGNLVDPTGGADSYVNLKLAKPSWATDDKLTLRIGNHSFYRVEI